MKTIAVISDTHSFIDPRIIKIVSECDYAVHAGDICGVEVIDAMKPKSGEVIPGHRPIFQPISKPAGLRWTKLTPAKPWLMMPIPVSP